jgi:hypothetical protein
MERGPHGERCPYPETFLTYLPGPPVKEPPSSPPVTESLMNKVKLRDCKIEDSLALIMHTHVHKQHVSQKATEYLKLMYQTLRNRDMLLCTQIYQATQKV